MAKIYVLTAGEYSDYHIEGVYSSREEAEKYKRFYPDDDCVDIEEFEIDSVPYSFDSVKDNVVCWCIIIRIDECGKTPVVTKSAEKKSSLINGVKLNKNFYKYVVFVSEDIAKDEEHAKKIAFDKIAEFKARMLGVM